MKILVVGAGIGGLSAGLALGLAGHDVTILESASQLAEVGAGVQLTPNATRWFQRWGAGPDIYAKAAKPKTFTIRQDKDGQVLAKVPLRDLESNYGAPYIVVHRADLHRILHQHVVKAGVEVRLNSRVVEYDFDGGRVTLATREQMQADLVVAVDGINSSARSQFLKDVGEGIESTGWAAYRMMAEVEKIKASSLAAEIVAEHNSACWIGDNKSAMTYMVYESSMLNMVLSHRDDVDTGNWTQNEYISEVERSFGDWDPRLTTVLKMIKPTVQNWPIYQVKTLPRWTSDTGRFVLIGDAAHAMAFYLSMGVSMAVEDVAALTECLALHISSEMDLRTAMSLFESVRKPRAEAVRDASLHAGGMLHMPSGEGREARNAALKTDGAICDGKEGIDGDRFHSTRPSYGIADHRIRDWCYAYDVVEDIRSCWKQEESKAGQRPTS